MEAISIMNEIQKLTIEKQIFIAEMIIKSIRFRESKLQMETAADVLYKDYLENKELTIFTNLDFENFYEAV